MLKDCVVSLNWRGTNERSTYTLLISEKAIVYHCTAIGSGHLNSNLGLPTAAS